MKVLRLVLASCLGRFAAAADGPAALRDEVQNAEGASRFLQDASMSLPGTAELYGGGWYGYGGSKLGKGSKGAYGGYNGGRNGYYDDGYYGGGYNGGGGKSGKGSYGGYYGRGKSGKGSSGGGTCSIEEMEGLFITPHHPFNVPDVEDMDHSRKLAEDHGRKLGGGYTVPGYGDLSYGTMAFHLPEGAGGNGGYGGWSAGPHGPRGVMEVEWCNTVCYDDAYAYNPKRRQLEYVNTGEGCVFNYQQLVATQSGFSRGGIIPFVVAPLGGGGGPGGPGCSAGGLLGVQDRCLNRRRLGEEDRRLTCLDASWCYLYFSNEPCREATNSGDDDGVCDYRRRLSDAAEVDPAAEQDQDAAAPDASSSRRLDPEAKNGGPDTYSGLNFNLMFQGEYDCAAGAMYVGGTSAYGGPLALASAGPAMKADDIESLGLGPFTCLKPDWMPPGEEGGWGAPPPPAPAGPGWGGGYGGRE